MNTDHLIFVVCDCHDYNESFIRENTQIFRYILFISLFKI